LRQVCPKKEVEYDERAEKEGGQEASFEERPEERVRGVEEYALLPSAGTTILCIFIWNINDGQIIGCLEDIQAPVFTL
jgi:hypothetical protein